MLDNPNSNLLKWANELRNTILPITIALRWRPASVATSDATTSFALIQVSPQFLQFPRWRTDLKASEKGHQNHFAAQTKKL